MKRFKMFTSLSLAIMLLMSMLSVAFATDYEVQLLGDDVFLPIDAKTEIVSYKMQWAEANAAEDVEGMAAAHNGANEIRAQYYGVYYAIDGSTYTDDDILRVAAVINHEAGFNDLDRFMVGSTFVNRWHSGRWGDTTTKVLAARGQYYNENNNRKHINFVNEVDREGYTKENNVFLYIANLCLYGEFTTPANIFGQAAFRQGSLYLMVDNDLLSGTRGLYNHYYCVMPSGDAMSDIDWAGNPTITATEAIARVGDLVLKF